MTKFRKYSRRGFIEAAAALTTGAALGRPARVVEESTRRIGPSRLSEFGYSDVTLHSELHERQLRENRDLLMSLEEDSLLKPLRGMSGMNAPGRDLGGWYHYDPDYDAHHGGDNGFAPACTFGQWVSALARMYAIEPSEEVRQKVLRLNQLYAETISADFYENNRFPAYCYDKFVCGLMDSHSFVKDPNALAMMNHTTDVALPKLPGKAIEHDTVWRPGKDETYTWDESYTNSENLFIAYQRGAGERYKTLGIQYLDDGPYYDPLANGKNVLAGRHAYSHVNSLCSAIMAYMTVGSEKHLRTAQNAFAMLQAQSFATGGWGPDEQLRAAGSNDVFNSLTKSHASFETPCGAYAHFKLTRYLLRVTLDSRYGDSSERVMYNTVLGSLPIQADGRSFYYSDYNFDGKKVFHGATWPCCSGTLPQVAADYRINAYFQGNEELFVNWYVPSIVRWQVNKHEVTLKQEGQYPFDEKIVFTVNAPEPTRFALHLRIPEWANGATASVRGKSGTEKLTAGRFARIEREWKNGDRVELELPMKMRLESIDARNPDTVALLRGPLVLFAIADGRTVKITKDQLLKAKQTSPQEWLVESATGKVKLLPFTAIGQEQYTTYLQT